MAIEKEKEYLIDNPTLMAEWDWEKNNELGLNPQYLLLGSNKKAWWICINCHNKWQASIYHRRNNHGCPICARKKAAESAAKSKRQKNGSFADKFPELIKEWDFSKNIENPADISCGTHKKVWWLCSHGHSYLMSVASRTSRNSQCPVCLGRQVSAGQNDFETKNAELLTQWNYKRNTIKPCDITYKSRKKVWWICEKGHEWEASVYCRTVLKQGCPHCYNEQHRVNKNNNLQVLYPQIAKEWNYSKNAPLKPFDIKATSTKKFWWICEKGHEWETTPYSRIGGSSCPYCAPNQSKVSNDNSLLACYPDIAKEWNYEKNGALTPDKIRFGSKKKVWWKCPLGHEWQAVVSSRTNRLNGRGCPICNREYKTSFPEQAVLYYIKNYFNDAISGYISDGFEIDIFIPSLSFGIEYDGMVYHTGKKNETKEERKNSYCKSKGIKLLRLKETMDDSLMDTNSIVWCHYTPNNDFLNSPIRKILREYLLIVNPNVDIARDSIAIQEQYVCSVKEKSIARIHPNIAREWHPTKNGSLKPEFVRAASNKKYWWLCPNGHEYEMSALNRHNGFKCPYCSGRSVLVGYNDLNTLYPQIANEWDHEKNGDITPQDVTTGTNRKFWWKCSKGHSWQTSIITRVKGGNCPYCSPYQSAVCIDNCLATLNPSLAKEWDYEKNINITPFDVRPNSDRKVWWKCDKGHSWQASIKSRNKGNKCPYCSNQRVLKGFNDIATTNPELLIDWDYEKNTIITPDSIVSGSNKQVWWKCHICGSEWQTKVYARYQGRGKCPKCKGETN